MIINNLKKTQDALNIIASIKRNLGRLGIVLNTYGDVSYRWEESKSIKGAVYEKYPFGMGLKNSLTLSLAESQEAGNAFVCPMDIEYVNTFFETSITFNEVQDFNSKYI